MIKFKIKYALLSIYAWVASLFVKQKFRYMKHFQKWGVARVPDWLDLDIWDEVKIKGVVFYVLEVEHRISDLRTGPLDRKTKIEFGFPVILKQIL